MTFSNDEIRLKTNQTPGKNSSRKIGIFIGHIVTYRWKSTQILDFTECIFQKSDDVVSDEAEDDSEDSEKILTQDEIQKIVKQAEFYLSEEYLMKNAYLLRQVFPKIKLCVRIS